MIRFSVDPNRYPKTRIMATVGPSSKDYDTIKEIVDSGASWLRINAAHLETAPGSDHLSYEEADQIAAHVRRLRVERRQVVGIYYDLGGPKIRVHHVLDVQRNEANGNVRERWLHPSVGDEVVVRAWNPRAGRTFRSRLQSFERQSGAQVKWSSEEMVRKFFGESVEKSAYELILGDEVTSFADFDASAPINLKDGWCALRILRKEQLRLVCKVEHVDSKFEFQPGQGATPYRHIFPHALTNKDIGDVEHALRMGADIISLSFVCSADDAETLRNTIRQTRLRINADGDFIARQSELYRLYLSECHRLPVFAKIETAFAVLPDEGRRYAAAKGHPVPVDPAWSPLADIANRFDGLMAARGDLAVEVSKFMVPRLQREIIEIARLKARPVIVATEMLESMRKGDASTRAEIQDINTAVHQEADMVMLSGETSKTKDRPSHAVSEMREAIECAETELITSDRLKNFDDIRRRREGELTRNLVGRDPERRRAVSRLAQGQQACLSALALDSNVILASAQTGEVVVDISGFRPSQKILSITEDTLTGVRLLQYRGVFPIVMERRLTRTVDEFVDIANEIHAQIGIPTNEQLASTFRVPGLIRITPRSSSVPIDLEIANILHEFTLPVTPRPVPEIERKYALSAMGWRRLVAALKGDATTWSLVRQANLYFTDSRDVLAVKRIMLRVRVEDPTAHTDIGAFTPRVFLTLKDPARISPGRGEEERPEVEFELTREVGVDEGDNLTLRLQDFHSLPRFYHDYIWQRHREALEPVYGALDAVRYKLVAKMITYRHRFEMSNGLVLEVDECRFRDGDVDVSEYELELELRAHAELDTCVSEYLHDKLCRLDVPSVRVDLGVMDNPPYPTKAMQAFAYAGYVDRSVLRRVEEIRAQVQRSHGEACDICRSYDARLSREPVTS